VGQPDLDDLELELDELQLDRVELDVGYNVGLLESDE
jgi:hypothetical protein